MKGQDITEAPTPEMRASLTALRRAAAMARQIAIQTGTDLVIFKDGKIVKVPAEQLLRESHDVFAQGLTVGMKRPATEEL